jgi:pimeloyl-ACP methyl ester carboxylesterase
MSKTNLQPVAEERYINVRGLTTRYFTAGNVEPTLVLIHGVGDSAADWLWVMPTLAQRQRVLAVDLPGHGKSGKSKGDYSLDFLTQFVGDFLTTVGVERAVLVGNSLGGLLALRLALLNSEQVVSLVLVDSAGLGQRVCFALSHLTAPMYGELAISWCKTPLGAAQRAWSRAALIFKHPAKTPPEWIAEQERMAKNPGFLEASLSVLRAQINPFGQRQVLLDSLPNLSIPTLVVWGVDDLVVSVSQARDAISRLRHGHLALIPNCGHAPQVERPEIFTAELNQFLGSRREEFLINV